jgi:hypothetical protein
MFRKEAYNSSAVTCRCSPVRRPTGAYHASLYGTTRRDPRLSGKGTRQEREDSHNQLFEARPGFEAGEHT